MKSRISRRTRAIRFAQEGAPVRKTEVLRAFVAVTMAIALIGTGAIALPSLAPSEAEAPLPQVTLQLDALELASIESLHENAAMLTGSIK